MAKLVLEADSRQVRTATSDLRQLNDTGAKSENIIGKLRGAFVLLGGATAIMSTTRRLADFSQQMSTVQAISGASTTELAALRKEITTLGATTRFSASQAAEGAQFLARAGFDTDQILASLNSTLTLAQAGAIDLGAAADIASNVLTGFRLPADEAGRAVDVLAFAANRSNTDVLQLGDAMSYVAPIASGLGVSLEETAAAIGALSDAGIQGSTAGTGLRRVLSVLESPTDSVRKSLEALGVTADEVKVSQVGLTGALERLASAGITTGEALEIFGDRGGPAFEVLASSIPRINEMNRALEESKGFAQGVSDVMDDNLNGALLSVSSAMEGLIIRFGELGADSSATAAANSLADGIRGLTDNLEIAVEAGTALAVLLGGRLVGSLGATTAAKLSSVAATIQQNRATLALASAEVNQLRLQQASLASQLRLAQSTQTLTTLRTQLAANTRLLVAAENNLAAAQARTAVGTAALTRGLSLLGGPVGVVALVGYGIYRLSESYRANRAAAEERLEKMREELRLNPQLATAQEEYNRAVQRAYKPMEQYTSAVDEAFRAQVQGMNSSQIQEQFDKSSAALERAEGRLARFTERFAPNTMRVMRAQEEVRKYTAQLEILRAVYPELTTTEEQQAESLRKVTQRLTDQIYELEEGKDAYELLMLTREASIALDSKEAQNLQDLIDKRNELIEKKRQEREEENRASSVASRVEGGLGLDQESQIRLRLDNELAILEEYYQDKEGMESEWQARREQLISDAEERIRQLNTETTRRSIVNWESFQDRAAGALAAVAVGAMDGKEAIRGLALSIAQEAIGSLIKMGIQAAITNATTATSATTAIATTTTAATTSATTTAAANTGAAISAATTAGAIASGLASSWAPAAAFASLATLGTNAPAAMAGIASTLAFTLAGQTVTSLLSGVIQTAFNTSDTIRGARAQGGQVIAGERYLIGERGPEVWEAPATGRITPYNELMRQAGSGGGDVIIHNYTGAPTRVEEREVPDELSPGQVRKIREIFIGDMDDRGPMFQSVTRNTTANPRTE